MDQLFPDIFNNKKRVELHCHSNYGGDALISSGTIRKKAASRNLCALAICDRNSILSFPTFEPGPHSEPCSCRPLYGMELEVEYKNGSHCLLSLLIRNKNGMENICRLIREQDKISSFTACPAEKLSACREGLLIGSGCEEGRLYPMVFSGASEDSLTEAIRKLDYIELLPGEHYRNANLLLLKLCEKTGRIAVAVSNAHYLNAEDRSAYDILSHHLQRESLGTHLLSCQEMLEALSYLDDDTARRVVIDNSHKIADLCETVTICPQGSIFPQVENSILRLHTRCLDAIPRKYQKEQWEAAEIRLEQELLNLRRCNTEHLPLHVKELMDKLSLRSCDISLRGTAGGSIVFYLLDISETDPLKYQLEPEMIFSLHGDRILTVDINIPPSVQNAAFWASAKLEGLDTSMRCCYAENIGDDTAEEMILSYEAKKQLRFTPEEHQRIFSSLKRVFHNKALHPGSVFLFPEGSEYEKNVPFTVLPDGMKCLYFERFSYEAYAVIDLLPHPTPELLKELAKECAVNLADVPCSYDEVKELFEAEPDGSYQKCAILPEFQKTEIRKMMELLPPTSFENLITLCGLSHGNGTWYGNAELLLQDPARKPDILISDRDQLFTCLLSLGLDKEFAFRIADSVRKGKIARGRFSGWEQACVTLRNAGAPQALIESCEKVQYLFPRAHIISYLQMDMRLGWFAIHRPQAFAKLSKQLSAANENKGE